MLLGDKRPLGRVTGHELRQALDMVLGEADYSLNARRIGKTLKDAGGYLQAARKIEAFCQPSASPGAV
jgi:UDP:flavonoid glycosyltransferase YjiC (YdhE family)